MNYPYLAGFLESELKNLATDDVFLRLKNDDYRRDYIRQLIKNAYAQATEFQSKENEKLATSDVLDDFNYVGSRHHY